MAILPTAALPYDAATAPDSRGDLGTEGGARQRVLRVMGRVPRCELAPAPMQPLAYADRALPVGHGETISQPIIVALMTDLLELTPEDKVL